MWGFDLVKSKDFKKKCPSSIAKRASHNKSFFKEANFFFFFLSLLLPVSPRHRCGGEENASLLSQGHTLSPSSPWKARDPALRGSGSPSCVARGLSRVAGAEEQQQQQQQHRPPTGTRPRAAAPTPNAVRCPGAVQQRAHSSPGPGRAGPAHAHRDPRPPRREGLRGRPGGSEGRGGGGGGGGAASPSSGLALALALALRLAEPREAETLSPSMQREEGFNTKMADGPDEYETETGCVPLLHPEVRDGAERLPGTLRSRGLAPSASPGAAAEASGAVTCGGTPGEAEESESRPERGGERADNGGGDSGAGPAGAGSGTPSLAVPGGQRWGWRWSCGVAALPAGAGATGAC